MAETLSTDCGSYVGGATAWKFGNTSGDMIPVADNAIQDLLRGLGMSLSGTAAAPAPARALVNQILPTGLAMVQTVPGAELATFTTRAPFAGTYVNTMRIGGAQTPGTFPAGALNILGRSLRVKSWGTLGTTGTPNYTIDVALGAGILATSGAIAMVACTNPAPWSLDVFATVTTVGATGVIVSGGVFTYIAGTGVTYSWSIGNSTPGTGLTADFTAALAFSVNATCGSSSGSNRLKMYGCTVEIIG